KGVKKLEPGSCLVVAADGQLDVQSYWTLHPPSVGSLSEEEWVERMRAVCTEAIRQQLTASDVSVGVLLSGGLDSSLIVALLSEVCEARLKTFSIGFEDTPEECGQEFQFSDMVAEQYNTQHEKICIPNAEVLRRLPDVVRAMSEPMVGQDAVSFYLLAEKVREKVKVVLSGQGADEVFAGYDWYPAMSKAGGQMNGKHQCPEEALNAFAPHYFDRSHQEWLELVDPRHHVQDVTSQYISKRLTEGSAKTFLGQVLSLDVTTLAVDDPVKRVDNMTMSWGLEARVPYLDHKLVEEAMAAPDELKLRSGGKYLLKALARGRLPEAIIH
ncbi:asnB, partial [Symbiodinium pilosum]